MELADSTARAGRFRSLRSRTTVFPPISVNCSAPFPQKSLARNALLFLCEQFEDYMRRVVIRVRSIAGFHVSTF